MRANSCCAVLCAVALWLGGRAPLTHAQNTVPAPASSTAQTVGQMLRLDAALALERVREKLPVPAAAAAPAARTLPGGVPAAPATPQLEILAILGLSGAPRVDLILNGRLYRMLTVGRVVDKWQLAEVQGRCIRLVALEPSRSTDVQQCFAEAPSRAPQTQPSPLARSLAGAEAFPLPVPTPPPGMAGAPSRPAAPMP